MTVNWKKVERKGNVAAHWEGTDSSGRSWGVFQRKPVKGTRENNRVADLVCGGRRVGTFPNVAAAKAAACQ